jgi:catechol 2,3-dioxygenase-like lactoylglutathione lyase family enzyme
MKSHIALITILTDHVPDLVRFYRDVLGFAIQAESGEYVEFESPGVRFAICARSILFGVTQHPSYQEMHRGQAFELAFQLETPQAVDEAYREIILKGAIPVQTPADMPWGQRTAIFADPDGNIHELFCDLTQRT